MTIRLSADQMTAKIPPTVPVRRGTPSPQVSGSAIPDWKRRLPVNNNGNPPLTWEGPNGPCEEKHGDQCQCVKCAGPNKEIYPKEQR